MTEHTRSLNEEDQKYIRLGLSRDFDSWKVAVETMIQYGKVDEAKEWYNQDRERLVDAYERYLQRGIVSEETVNKIKGRINKLEEEFRLKKIIN